ncbi:hypothetical protein [Streptomyces exfoliatus]|uniref:hypothetical protein n=1 Tax=Streptomyces exfoliatus TaxID=1905 RepID=UPI003C2DB13D
MDDEPWPGVVEVQFTDAAGQRWSLFDKPPIFAATGELGPDTSYPVEVTVACAVAEGHGPAGDNEVVTVSTSPAVSPHRTDLRSSRCGGSSSSAERGVVEPCDAQHRVVHAGSAQAAVAQDLPVLHP